MALSNKDGAKGRPRQANLSAVQGSRAETYVLITLIALAFSVITTRLFLGLTGYPQLGGTTFHIAHAIWGGLLLYAAALLPLILSNRWVLYASAVLNGLGAGLFIDEVGKFITRDLNYFYPPAAPLVYAFFLLGVLLYQYVRREMRRESPRTELYHVLEELKEVLDGDLDQREYERLVTWLRSARRSESENLARLAGTLEEYLRDPATLVQPLKPTVWSRTQARFERAGSRVSPRVHLAAVVVVLGTLSVLTAADAGLLLWSAFQPGPFRQTFDAVLMARGNLKEVTDVGWRLVRIGLEGAVGLIAFIGLVYLFLHRIDLGTRLGVFAFLVSLTMVNLLNFYFDQFRAVSTALVEFIGLLIILSYRNWRLPRRGVQRVREHNEAKVARSP